MEIEEFGDVALNKSVTQRIVFVAANFRKEVTSTVLWLLKFKLRIQCFRVTPYSLDEQHFLNVEQIIPTKDTEEFMIRMADKAQDENAVEEEKLRHKDRRAFWVELLKAMNAQSGLFQNVSPGTSSWIAAGVAGIGLNFVITRASARAEVWISRADRAQNKFIFDELFKKKAAIESAAGTASGHDLVWERLDEGKASRVKYEAPGNVFDREQRPEMISFMVDAMVRLDKAFREPLAQLNQKLKHRQENELVKQGEASG